MVSVWSKVVFVLLMMAVINGTNAQEVQSFRSCADCHRQITHEWQQSRHAQSTERTNPFFAAMVKWARSSSAEDVEKCKKCHQPVSALGLNEYDSRTLAVEGVTCDVCHATRMKGNGKDAWFELLPTNVKQGPSKDAVPVSHSAEFSSVLTSPQFCQTCHGNMEKSHQFDICSTEEEYHKSSFARKGVTCQDCHMPAMEGKSADLGKIRNINSHIFYGGYNAEILRNCANVKITLEKNSSALRAAVEVTNRTVGHSLPTGSPLRMVVLTVQALDENDQVLWQNFGDSPFEDSKSVFMRLLQNDSGAAPVPPWEATSIKFDQRLSPDESRTLVFDIPVPHVKQVQATLTYFPAPATLISKFGLEARLQPTIIASTIQTLSQELSE
ncbi:MAG: hypothetical protein EHM72_00835 [Calditrichaeota bacterium]|nr:MAG: hypothetical protein EHM72_00835 [Calditrichota bacterium]